MRFVSMVVFPFVERALMNEQLSDDLEAEAPDQILQQAVAAIQAERVPVGPPPQLVATTLNALRESVLPHTRFLPFKPTTKIVKVVTTAAAILLIAGSITLLGLALNSPSSAFGQVLKRVREVRRLSYFQSQTIAGQQRPITTRVFIAENGRRRSELLGSDKTSSVVTIFDTTGNIRLVLMETTKSAIIGDAKVRHGHQCWDDVHDVAARFEKTR